MTTYNLWWFSFFRDDKKDELLKAVRSLEDDEKILIFAATKRSVDYIERLLGMVSHDVSFLKIL